MLAYVFWHSPAAAADADAYEAAAVAFHASLAAAPPPGFRASAAFARAPLPWLDGYEDWYLVEDWAALGVLNTTAVQAPHRTVHDDVAHRSVTGTGAVYALARGDLGLDLGAVRSATWSDEPGNDGGALWQRQLVLGPAPEFCTMHADAAGGAVPRSPLTP